VVFQVEVFRFVTSCSNSSSSWRWRQHGPVKHWYPTTTLHPNSEDLDLKCVHTLSHPIFAISSIIVSFYLLLVDLHTGKA